MKMISLFSDWSKGDDFAIERGSRPVCRYARMYLYYLLVIRGGHSAEITDTSSMIWNTKGAAGVILKGAKLEFRNCTL